MKKCMIIISFLCFLFLTSCGLIDLLTKCRVTFNFCNGESSVTTSFDLYDTIDFPTTSMENANLVGWYRDQFYLTEFTSTSIVYESIDLYAKWEMDYYYYENILTEDTKNSVVTYYEEETSIMTKTITQGTAVAFDEDENYYYLMTNNHVVANDDDRKTIILTDGTELKNYRDGTDFFNIYRIEEVYKNEAYDLAIIRLQKRSNYSINIARFSETDIKNYDEVFCFGTPNGNRNTLTAGYYFFSSTIEVEGHSSNVTFDVLLHTAEIHTGSSGGPVFNKYGEIVGINYAGCEDPEGLFEWAAAIPLNKIYEFIQLSNYLV